MELREALAWLASGGGAGIFVFWLFERWAWIQKKSPEFKRYAALAGASVVAMAAFAVLVGLGYVETPAGGREWLEAFFTVAFIAVMGSQSLHANRKL